jgi:hypothetical protein
VSTTEPVRWSDREDEVLGGDLTAVLAYVTPARGVVLTAVAPVGLRDRERGTVTFTTSLGFGRKLDRMRDNPSVALAYHAREHGFATAGDYLLVQGRASFDLHPSPETLETVVRPASTRFMGAPKTGVFWDRWLREYYSDRVLVEVAVARVIDYDNRYAEGEASVTGPPLGEAPAPQDPPAKGTGPRIDVARAARRIAKLPHVLLGYLGADGFPVVLPVAVAGADPEGLRLRSPQPLPPGGRRAGLLAHRYEPQLIGLEARQHTGWLSLDGNGGATYAPHTETGFRAPANKTVLLLANGFMAKRGLKQARRAQAAS